MQGGHYYCLRSVSKPRPHLLALCCALPIRQAPKYAGQQVSVKPCAISGWGGDKQLVLEASNRHYGIAAALPTPIDNAAGGGRDLVVQYEVALTEGLTCGGAYLKVCH